MVSDTHLPGYCNRLARNGGGVLVANRENVHATRQEDLEMNNVECVAVELKMEYNKSTLLYTFYRPPNSNPDIVQHLNASSQSIPESSCNILVGDFNLPAINWSLDQPTPTTNGGQLEDSFCDLVGDNFLEQLITGPAHIGRNKLDLLLSNSTEIISNVNILAPSECNFPSDHHQWRS